MPFTANMDESLRVMRQFARGEITQRETLLALGLTDEEADEEIRQIEKEKRDAEDEG